MKKPTKAQLEARIKELESQQVPTTASAPELNRALINATERAASARALAETSVQEKVYEVTNLSPTTLSVIVREARGIGTVAILFETRGTTKYLTASQIAEVQERCNFFKDGLLIAPEIVPVSPNAIDSYDSFIKSLTPDTVRIRITQFTSSEVLFGLYHYLEDKRFEWVNNETVEKPLETVENMVLHATTDRLRELTGYSFSAHGGE